MSRIKNMPAIGWMGVGIAIAVLAVPTVAGAKAALKFTGIEGTSGNQADVTTSHQLLTTNAPPSDIFNVSRSVTPANAVLLSPTGKDAIVTHSVDESNVPSGDSGPPGFG